MAQKRKYASLDTKLQAIAEVDRGGTYKNLILYVKSAHPVVLIDFI